MSEMKAGRASAEATYRDGKLVRVMTRGDGAVGVDITAPCLRIESLPKTIELMGTVVVRGEVCMRKSRFPLLNDALVAAGRDPTKNTRNGTVGLIKTLKNIEFCHYLDFQAFDLLIVE
jgi:DNA ligase (NAD+)